MSGQRQNCLVTSKFLAARELLAYLKEKRAQMKDSIKRSLTMLREPELDSLCASLDSVGRIAAKLERMA